MTAARPILLVEDNPMDINMPKIGGLEVLRQLKSHPVFRTILLGRVECADGTLAVCRTWLMYSVANATGMVFVEAGATDC